MKKVKLGDIIHVKFYDHADVEHDDDPNPLLLQAVGMVVDISKIDYKILTWGDASDIIDHNSEMYSIIRSTIKEIKVYR